MEIEPVQARAAARANLAPGWRTQAESMKRYEQCGRSKTSGSVPGTWEHWPRLADADRVKEALTVVRGIGDERTRDNVLAKFAPHLARLGRTNDALVMARRIGDESARARALGELGQVDDALALARGISDESARAFALAELAPGWRMRAGSSKR